MQNAQELSSIPKVNLEFLHTVCDGDQDFMSSIIQTFVEDAPEIMQRLSSHTSQESWSEAGLAAHQLKPSLQFIGLTSTLAQIQKIELRCKKGYELNTVPDLVYSVVQQISAAVEELREWKY